MLLSMTGFGEAQVSQEGVAVTVEIRTVNSRYFKPIVRVPEGYASLESQVEKAVRQGIKRGTITVAVRVDRLPSPDDYRINEPVLKGYRQQLEQISQQAGISQEVGWESLLALPGVVDENSAREVRATDDWPLIERALGQALDRVTQMRGQEGQAMAIDLTANCDAIRKELEEVETRVPLVVDAYQDRLTDRLNKLLETHEVTVDPTDIVREVGIFAERSDVAEEIVRLQSHLDQFVKIMEQKESPGRKLDFVTQEMFRETNTIGSKANDAQIAQRVVEMKACIERIREMIQNIE